MCGTSNKRAVPNPVPLHLPARHAHIPSQKPHRSAAQHGQLDTADPDPSILSPQPSRTFPPRRRRRHLAAETLAPSVRPRSSPPPPVQISRNFRPRWRTGVSASAFSPASRSVSPPIRFPVPRERVSRCGPAVRTSLGLPAEAPNLGRPLPLFVERD